MKILSLVSIHNRFSGIHYLIQSLDAQILDSAVFMDLVIVDTSTLAPPSELICDVHARSWIKYIPTTRNLYWSQAMQFGWVNRPNNDYDYVICLNDDIEVSPTSLRTFVRDAIKFSHNQKLSCIAASFANDYSSTCLSYGGLNRKSALLPLHFKQEKGTTNNSIVNVDVVNFNLCIIPFGTAKLLNFFDDRYTHRYSDFDFCLRCSKIGLKTFVSTTIIGVCPRNACEGTSLEPKLSRLTRLTRRMSSKEHPIIDRFIFCLSHGGLLWPLYFISPYMNAIIFNK